MNALKAGVFGPVFRGWRTRLKRLVSAPLPHWLSGSRVACLVALLLSLAGGIAAYRVAVDVFDAMPHLEDEMAYTWQARVIATRRLAIPAPEHGQEFLVPFVVDYHGLRFGKYPLGWPVVLALGVFLDARTLVNPILAALGVWFSFRLGQRLFGDLIGVLAAGLTVTSPFFLLNSGSLLSHPLGFLLSLAFVLFWMDVIVPKTPLQGRLGAFGAGGALGLLALTRPFTALAVALPFGLYGFYRLVTGPGDVRRRVVTVGLVAGGLALLHLAWQWAMTGDPLLNPYQLWWPYDRVGFGPGVGVRKAGHTLQQAWLNTRFSLSVGSADIFGWFRFSYFLVPFGIWALVKAPVESLRRILAWQAILPFFSLVLAYMAYWIGSWLFGPRYYYEGFFSLVYLTAVGIAWLAGFPVFSSLSPAQPARRPGRKDHPKARPVAVLAIVLFLVATNVSIYLPLRLKSMENLYNISAERVAPFLQPEFLQVAPAVIIVKAEHWTDYGTFLDLQNPDVLSPENDAPYVFVFGGNPLLFEDLERLFPGRRVYRYDPETPLVLYPFR